METGSGSRRWSRYGRGRPGWPGHPPGEIGGYPVDRPPCVIGPPWWRRQGPWRGHRGLVGSAPESTNRPYAIAKIAGIELCRPKPPARERYLAVMPANLRPGDHYDVETSLGGSDLAPAEDRLLRERGPQRAPLWSSPRTLRLRERSARIRHSSKVRWGISWGRTSRSRPRIRCIAVWIDGVLIRRRYSCVLMWASVQTPLFRSCSLQARRTDKR